MHFPDSFVAAAKDRQMWKVDGEPFELDAQYKVIDYLGAGAYGVVCAAYDEASLKMVAIKKCKQIFHSRTLAKRTLRELRILRHLNHENVRNISYYAAYCHANIILNRSSNYLQFFRHLTSQFSMKCTLYLR